MYEKEVKILDINKEEVVQKLLSMGAKKVFEGDIITYFFDFPTNDIMKNKQLLRLRKLSGKTFLGFKKPVSWRNAKVMEEYEVEVSDFNKVRLILKELGLSECYTAKKQRTSYVLGDARFEIDKYEGSLKQIPLFLEIEAKNIKVIYHYARVLGFKKHECKPYTIKDLIDKCCK